MRAWFAEGRGSTVWVGVYLAITACISLVALLLTRETRDHDYVNNIG